MSQYLVLSHIDIQNANSIAGFTWGFPAITGFLGFTHALSRKISQQFEGEFDTAFDGCAVVCHKYQQHIYSNNRGFDYRFLQHKFGYSFKPKKKDGRQVDPSIIEEGKMNLTVSLVIQLSKSLTLTEELIKQFEQTVLAICNRLRIAGGSILNIKQAKLLSANTQEQQQTMLKKVKRLTLPGFVLFDRSHYLQEHYQTLLASPFGEQENKPTLFDAWLDFCVLKSKAIPKLVEGQIEPDLQTEADWQYQPKPKMGYLVPLMTGYKAISDLYKPGEVANTRDKATPSCFVEAIHSIGEWKGVHLLDSIEAAIWKYRHEGQWYLCEQRSNQEESESLEIESINSNEELLHTLNFNDALNNW